MASRRLPLIAALALGGGGGYYLYNAGGNAKVAEKQVEHDAARLSSKVRSELPGREKEAKTELKVLGEQAGAKFDETVSQAKAATRDFDAKAQGYANDAEKQLQQYKKEAGQAFGQTKEELNAAVNKFDKTVEQKAAEAKSGLSSWFGGK